jgi:hypothetical protein
MNTRPIRLSAVDVCALGLIQKYGKVEFTLTETAAILNRGIRGIAAYLHSYGITVKRTSDSPGTKKVVNVYDIASVAVDTSQNVAPIRND